MIRALYLLETYWLSHNNAKLNISMIILIALHTAQAVIQNAYFWPTPPPPPHYTHQEEENKSQLKMNEKLKSKPNKVKTNKNNRSTFASNCKHFIYVGRLIYVYVTVSKVQPFSKIIFTQLLTTYSFAHKHTRVCRIMRLAYRLWVLSLNKNNSIETNQFPTIILNQCHLSLTQKCVNTTFLFFKSFVVVIVLVLE